VASSPSPFGVRWAGNVSIPLVTEDGSGRGSFVVLSTIERSLA
jgi:hypothetical protein